MDPVQPSALKVLLLTSLDLALAIVVGGLIAAPAYVVGWRGHHDRFKFSEVPDNDHGLAEWGWAQDAAKDFEVSRRDREIFLEYKNKSRKPLTPPWEEFGYKGLQEASVSKALIPTVDQSVGMLVLVLCGQFGFLLFGVRRLRVSAKAGLLKPSPLAGPVGPALQAGLVAGFGMLVFGIAWGLAMHAIFGKSVDTTGIWKTVQDLPTWGRISIVLAGAVVAPLCEEIFFRGACFGTFTGAGHPRAGLWASAVLFALVHFHLSNTPAYIVFGLILATVYRRTNSILAPMLAHLINNAGAFALLLIPKA
jgi:membrane protease YdiL (CAAX protease family)